MIRRLRRRVVADERGFTVAEVVTCVVVLGLVIGPLMISVNQAITMLPDAQARTQTATDLDPVITRFADDVANLDYAGTGPNLVFPNTVGTTVYTCEASASPTDRHMYIPIWLDGESHFQIPIWQLRSTTEAPGLVRIEVRRGVWGTPVQPMQTQLTGYCAPGQVYATITRTAPDTDGTGVQTQYDLIRVVLTLSEQQGEPPKTINLEGRGRIKPS